MPFHIAPNERVVLASLSTKKISPKIAATLKYVCVTDVVPRVDAVLSLPTSAKELNARLSETEDSVNALFDALCRGSGYAKTEATTSIATSRQQFDVKCKMRPPNSADASSEAARGDSETAPMVEGWLSYSTAGELCWRSAAAAGDASTAELVVLPQALEVAFPSDEISCSLTVVGRQLPATIVLGAEDKTWKPERAGEPSEIDSEGWAGYLRRAFAEVGGLLPLATSAGDRFQVDLAPGAELPSRRACTVELRWKKAASASCETLVKPVTTSAPFSASVLVVGGSAPEQTADGGESWTLPKAQTTHITFVVQASEGDVDSESAAATPTQVLSLRSVASRAAPHSQVIARYRRALALRGRGALILLDNQSGVALDLVPGSTSCDEGRWTDTNPGDEDSATDERLNYYTGAYKYCGPHGWLSSGPDHGQEDKAIGAPPTRVETNQQVILSTESLGGMSGSKGSVVFTLPGGIGTVMMTWRTPFYGKHTCEASVHPKSLGFVIDLTQEKEISTEMGSLLEAHLVFHSRGATP